MNNAENVKKAMFCMTRQCWEQGIVAQTLQETGDIESLQIVVHEMVLRQGEDGRLCVVEETPAVTDSAFGIPSTLFLGELEQNEVYLNAVEKNIHFLLHEAERANDGTLFHMKNTGEIWADSAGFLPYALALCGNYEEAIGQMKGLHAKLYDPMQKLYYHVWDEHKRDYKRKVFWGVGNGWFLTGMIRLYDALPATFSEEKAWLKDRFHELLSTLLKWRNERGLIRDEITNTDSYFEVEILEMISYSIYRGIMSGIVPLSYMADADELRELVYENVSENGLVMNCASSPDFLQPGTSVEGQAHFLLMEYAHAKVVMKEKL